MDPVQHHAVRGGAKSQQADEQDQATRGRDGAQGIRECRLEALCCPNERIFERALGLALVTQEHSLEHLTQ